MKTTDLPIPEPCNADWEAMTGDERRRFCAMCQKHVTDISTFTEREADAFLDANPEACVQYTAVRDTIVFAPRPRKTGFLRRLVGLGALATLSVPAAASGHAEGGWLFDWVASWFAADEVEQVEVEDIDVVLVEPNDERPASVIPEIHERPPEPVLTKGKPIRKLRGRIARPPKR